MTRTNRRHASTAPGSPDSTLWESLRRYRDGKSGQPTSKRRHCDRERCSAIGSSSPRSLLDGLPPSLRSRLPVPEAVRIRLNDRPCATSASRLCRQSAERGNGKLNHARNALASISHRTGGRKSPKYMVSWRSRATVQTHVSWATT